MVRARRRRLARRLWVVTTSVVAAAVASGATGPSFKGKTSQRQPISLRISGSYVRKLNYWIVDKCPRGQKLINHDHGFSPIRITHAKFGGTFLDPAHHDKAVISATIKKGVVRGSLSDRTRSATTHRQCSGTATFTIRHA